MKFPIIALLNKRHLHFARNEDDISICTKTALKNGFYNNLSIVDSDGVQYVVQDAEKINSVGLFWGYNIFLNQKIRVKLKMADTSGQFIDLHKFKELLKNILEVSDNHGNFSDDSKHTMKVLNSLKTHNEIITHLCDAFYKRY